LERGVRWKEGVDRRLGIANRSRDRLDQNTEFVKEKVTKIINRKPFYSIYHFPRYRPVLSTFHPSQFNTATHRLEYTIPSLPLPIPSFPTPYYPSIPPLPPATIPPKMPTLPLQMPIPTWRTPTRLPLPSRLNASSCRIVRNTRAAEVARLVYALEIIVQVVPVLAVDVFGVVAELVVAEEVVAHWDLWCRVWLG
jgi:hypothetical protein